MPRKTKKPAARKVTTRKCKHKATRFTWSITGNLSCVTASHCHDCGERLSLGSSNDVGCEVEIRAAELSIDASRMTDDERYGALLHGDMQADIADNRVLAGWLSREILRGADSDVGKFHWDPKRPLAGQFDLKLDAAGDLVASPQRDAFGELCDVLKEIGATMTLYGQPVTEGEVRQHVEAVVDAKLAALVDAVVDEPEAFDLEVADRAFITAMAADYEDPEAIEEIPDADVMEAIGSIFDRIAGVARATASEAAARLTVPALANEGPPSGFVAWPADEPRQYNGSGEPCDIWIGPCLCGATHTAEQRSKP